MTQSGNGVLEISSLLNVQHSKLSKAVKHFQGTGTNENRPERGRSRTANNAGNQKNVPIRIERKPRAKINSTRIMARAIGFSRESLRMILTEAGLKVHKEVEGHLITEQAKVKWLGLCKRLRKRFASDRHRAILFSDENWFDIEKAHNHQNDRIW
ncbi:hypothetical protein Y032_0680g1472 [Ancylostoma ceylanicum]|uniref:Uncharacterized protein n=1 Tax=Ancylostoma ceylanicum TaxID=53326 RepID=A0A016WIH3_9BILA|nr:hypothetical protein Y032_0680g1472 [Ancylostoma ceylanicum]